jgi:hypothetical protein
MSWKPEFLCQGSWCANGQAFATEAEAKSSAASRFQRWTVPTDYRAVESEEPVNYAFVEGRNKSLPAVK